VSGTVECYLDGGVHVSSGLDIGLLVVGRGAGIRREKVHNALCWT
jgi:hypothetical protein